MRKCSFLFFFIFFLAIAPAMAQIFSDTLKSVEVVEKPVITTSDIKSNLQIGQSKLTIPTQQKAQYRQFSLATLLAQQSPVFIKSYGINSMATLSIRGASAAQSSVLWKGIPILNPALGIADISQLQTVLFDNITLQYGSNAALLGSGNVGGALILDDDVFISISKPSLKTTVGLGFGSFGKYDATLKATYQNKKWRIIGKAFYQKANNNFAFKNDTGAIEKMQNARLNAYGAIVSTTYKIDSKQHLSLDFWYQKFDRQIPRALFESVSEKKQNDASLRSLLSWERSRKIFTFFAKASLNKEDLHYKDEQLKINSESQVWQYFQEIGAKINLQKKEGKSTHQLFFSVPFQYNTFQWFSNDSARQIRPAIVGSYLFQSKNKKLNLSANIRQEWVDGKTAPALPGAGIAYQLLENENWKIILRGAVQKTYRIPTLNELYNFPGGNTRLQPEQGWNREIGYDIDFAKTNWRSQDFSRWTIQHKLTYFNRKINDWIYWLGGAVWTPHNLAQVHNRGVETDNAINYIVNQNWTLHSSVKTAYILSTTTKSYMPNDNSIGKQIPYAPRYNGQLNIGATYKKLYLNYNHTYTGYRFTTTDESQYLMPYDLGNMQAMYSFEKEKYQINFTFQLQNVWNKTYQVVAQRPMPGRYFVAGAQITF